MARLVSRFASAAALLSALSMMAAPASAAAIPHSIAALPGQDAWHGWDIGQETANNHRDDRRYRRHGGGIGTGDLIAGVLVIGGIAAIASAANSNRRDRDNRDDRRPEYRSPDSRDRTYDYRGDREGDERYTVGGGIDQAVEICVREVERDDEVDRVENVSRTAEGWRVEGDLRNGHGFTCEIDRNGRVQDVDVEADVASNDRQWQEGDYARARERGDGRDEDGRYRTGEVGDFSGGH